MLNADDTKILLKAFLVKFKPILPSIISSNQIVYAEKWCISESGRLISDIIELCGNKNIPGFYVTINLEKAFDSWTTNFCCLFIWL